MAKQWKCARCSTKNDEGTLTCSNCRMIRGAVVVPSTFSAPGPSPAAPQDPSPDWPSSGDSPSTGETTPSGPSFWTPSGAASSEPYFPAAPAAPTPLWRRIPIGWVLFAVILGAGAIGGLITNAGRSSTGEITNDGDMLATDLRVGDCFDLKESDAESITDVTARPCTDEHEYELFHVAVMAEGPFPGDAAFDVFFEDNCLGTFETYVGKAYAESVLDIFWLTPGEEAWDEGDRSIQCAVYHPSDATLTGSLKESSQ
jgi:hypothetical protein